MLPHYRMQTRVGQAKGNKGNLCATVLVTALLARANVPFSSACPTCETRLLRAAQSKPKGYRLEQYARRGSEVLLGGVRAAGQSNGRND